MNSKIQHCVQLLSKLSWLPPLLARITIGVVFIQSGWGKLHDIERVIGYFTELGIPFPWAQAHFVAALEFGAGVFVLLGFTTRLASIPLIAIMIVAILTAKATEVSTASDLFGLSEFLYIVLLVWLLVSGPGLVALDHLIQNRASQTKPRVKGI